MSPTQQPRRSNRARKPTAKGRDYSDSLAQKQARSQSQAAAVGNVPPTNTINGSSSGQGNADGGPRRSKRIQAHIHGNSPGGNTGRPNKKRRLSESGSTVEGFMIKLYAEIHHAATVRTIGQWDRYWTQDLLRRARTVRFFDLATGSARHHLRARLDKFESDSPKEKRVAKLAKDDVGISYAQRLTEFCDNPNLLFLTICAHSKSFREAILRSDAESRALGEPEWSLIYSRIKECASSLELFARTHKFDWTDALFFFNGHFEDLLIIVYKHCQDARDKDGVSFGIGDDDLSETHPIGAEDKHKVHHHWALPVEDGEPAVWPSVKCTITQDLVNAGFVHGEVAVAGIPAEGNNLEVDAAAILPLKSKQVLQQFNIDQVIVLPNYDWPAEVHQVTYPDGSVYEDPTFCGFPKNPCGVCGAETQNAQQQQQSPQAEPACQCTFADLCKWHNKPPQDNHGDILVELYTTAEKGRGVRALQPIRKGTYLGEYTGEIYAAQPDANNSVGTLANPRYGLMTYHMVLDVARADDYTTAKAQAGYRPQYVVDAAHRGGWTRYINHSCAPNTRFYVMNVGQRTRIIIKAVRKIAFGEEITISYGKNYFEQLRIACRCGAPKCKYKNVGASNSSSDSSDDSGSDSGSASV
ncbi:uncharacterized protein Z520_10642 [Fonsecaea multimorphosa CBS 102226]|uniref:SET domain-containing protein n=1 Tax=Fonsecaea multimorphosa CBS 102226 TaxID=1442371 RepID=A0A0D2I979_9EURO|nr:uncharacterized protein Z520_10642 [Fonsecaea multimorphosa CBS 102226]KIX93736.1 hypothetical protein Z520_10642 [Fonsecaea multimorphosa CBS 102226]OAL19844.1 hypothetical protein AYO22_09371 [Fonsecaea multimorphosa]